jgi:outer membrane protein assembly factor BamA
VGARYDDRSGGAQSFDKVEAEAAGFVPIAGGRVVLGLHGWYVGTEATTAGGSVPFYLQPSLGGLNTNRGYTDFRFHDDHMVSANAEVRLALMTHLDFALFADAGNVAPRRDDLNFDKRSYGAGFRLHTRRETFAMMDIANGDEGWRVLFRLKDPMSLARLNKKQTLVPFVP